MAPSTRRAFVVGLFCATMAEGLQNVITQNMTEMHDKQPALVVLATNHGQGSSLLSHAIGSNPCFIDVGEPFSPKERWYSETGQDALFAQGGQPGQAKTFTKLISQINDYFNRIGIHEPIQLDPELHLKTKSMGQFFNAVQKEACDHLGRNTMCQGRCIMVHKLFPVYVSDNYSQVYDYLKSDETMVVQTRRNLHDAFEADKERFGMGPWGLIRMRQWEQFLNSLAHDVDGQKVWETFEINNHLFESPSNYFNEVARLYEAFHFNIVDKTLMLDPVRIAIEEEFANYDRRTAERSEKVEQD